MLKSPFVVQNDSANLLHQQPCQQRLSILHLRQRELANIWASSSCAITCYVRLTVYCCSGLCSTLKPRPEFSDLGNGLRCIAILCNGRSRLGPDLLLDTTCYERIAGSSRQSPPGIIKRHAMAAVTVAAAVTTAITTRLCRRGVLLPASCCHH